MHAPTECRRGIPALLALETIQGKTWHQHIAARNGCQDKNQVQTRDAPPTGLSGRSRAGSGRLAFGTNWDQAGATLPDFQRVSNCRVAPHCARTASGRP